MTPTATLDGGSTDDGAPDGGSPGWPAAIDCETAVRRLWDYLDGALPVQAYAEVEAHLAVCTLCPPHFTFARQMQRALARVGADGPAPDAGDALRARVRAALVGVLPREDSGA